MSKQFKYKPDDQDVDSDIVKPARFKYQANGENSLPQTGKWLSVHEPIFQDQVEMLVNPFLLSTQPELTLRNRLEKIYKRIADFFSNARVSCFIALIFSCLTTTTLCMLMLFVFLYGINIINREQHATPTYINTRFYLQPHPASMRNISLLVAALSIKPQKDAVTLTSTITPTLNNATITPTLISTNDSLGIDTLPLKTKTPSATQTPTLLTQTPTASATDLQIEIPIISTPSLPLTSPSLVPSIFMPFETTPSDVGMYLSLCLQLVTFLGMIILLSRSRKSKMSPIKKNVSVKTKDEYKQPVQNVSRSTPLNLPTAPENVPMSEPQPTITSEINEVISGQDPMPKLLSGFSVFVTRPKTSKEKNQDSISGGLSTNNRYRFIALADGVGMGKNSSIASKAIIDTFAEHISSLTSRPQNLPENFISKFYNDASEKIGQALTKEGLSLDTAATTFIGVIETYDHYVWTYLADGSIFQIAQSTEGFFASEKMLVAASPDVPPQIGARGKSDIHSFETFRKRGDEAIMWVIATDGMNKLERYMDDKTLISGTKAAERLAQEIWQVFQQAPSEFNNERIEEVLWRWLKRSQTTDDASIAVLISGEMYNYWKTLAEQNKPK